MQDARTLLGDFKFIPRFFIGRPHCRSCFAGAALAALLAAGVGATPAGADLGAPFATVSGVCDPTSGGYYDTNPVSSDHPNVIVRATASAGPTSMVFPAGEVDVATDFGAGDIKWEPYPYPIHPNDEGSVEVGCGDSTSQVNFSVEYFDLPSTPVTYQGQNTPNVPSYGSYTGHTPSSSLLDFDVPGTARYVADVSLTQGAIDIQGPNNSGTFASSGEFPLGVLSKSSGNPTELEVTPEDGPPAVWSITIHALPVRMLSLGWSAATAQPGQIEHLAYSLEGSASLTAVIVNSRGQEVRKIASSLNVSAGQHTLVWDGLDSSGIPVPDGTYTAGIAWTDAAGNTQYAGSNIVIDKDAPSVAILSSLPLPRSYGLKFSITDPADGVSNVVAWIDRTRITRGWYPSHDGGTVIYRPPNGWRRGLHKLHVIAQDRSGNRSDVIRWFRVR